MKRVNFRIHQRLHTAATFEPDDRDLSGTSVRPLFDFGNCPREREMHVHVNVGALRDGFVRAKRTRAGSPKTDGAELMRKCVQEKVTRVARSVQCLSLGRPVPNTLPLKAQREAQKRARF